MLRMLAAVQVLVLPGSLKHHRARFDFGMDTLLCLQSLGALSPAERARVTNAKVSLPRLFTTYDSLRLPLFPRRARSGTTFSKRPRVLNNRQRTESKEGPSRK